MTLSSPTRQHATPTLRCPKCGARIVPSPSEMMRWRKRAGLTQRQMAARLGISAAHVAYLESGRRMPGPSLIARYWKFASRSK